MRRYRPGNIYGNDLQAELELARKGTESFSRKRAQSHKGIQLNSKFLFVLYVPFCGYFFFVGTMTTSFSLLRTTSKVKEVGWVAGLNKETGLPSIDWMTSPG